MKYDTNLNDTDAHTLTIWRISITLLSGLIHIRRRLWKSFSCESFLLSAICLPLSPSKFKFSHSSCIKEFTLRFQQPFWCSLSSTINVWHLAICMRGLGAIIRAALKLIAVWLIDCMSSVGGPYRIEGLPVYPWFAVLHLVSNSGNEERIVSAHWNPFNFIFPRVLSFSCFTPVSLASTEPLYSLCNSLGPLNLEI